MSTFLEFKNASLFRQGEFVFRDLNWTVHSNENWVILGDTASGKTSLLQAIAGTLHLKEGEISYPFLQTKTNRWELKKFISLIHFTGSLVSGSEHYYQQRYNLSEGDDTPTVRQFLNNVHLEDLTSALKILSLLDVELIKLSNGQTRRVQLAKALAAKPALLLLDNPFSGLDIDGRNELRAIITNLIKAGNPIILTCNHMDDIPEGFTHALKLENQKITFSGVLKDYPQDSIPMSNSLNLPELNKTVIEFNVAVSFNDVSVRYGGQIVLNTISFQILKNEKWALIGANGSGKSTLLSLINADNPQAYANDIILFDEKKDKQSIWKIKNRIGYFSAELQAHFQEDLTVQDVLATGLTGTFVPKKYLSDTEENRIHALLSFYNKDNLLNRKYIQLSSGEQRLILFLRALMPDHDMLILDEPFQGFDQTLLQQSKKLIDQFCQNKTLLFVSHYISEIPSCVDRFIELKNGAIVQSGKLS